MIRLLLFIFMRLNLLFKNLIGLGIGESKLLYLFFKKLMLLWLRVVEDFIILFVLKCENLRELFW